MATEVATAFVSVVPSLKGFASSLTSEATIAADAAAKQIGDKFGSVGKQLTAKVTAPIVGLGAASVWLAANFESNMSQVAQALGTPGAPLENLTALAKQLGAETQFSAGQAAEAMVSLAKGGFSEAQISGGALAATMDLAAAGQLDLAQAASLVTASMNSFGIEATNASSIADALAGAANASDADVSDLGMALTQVAAAASLSGQPLSTTTAALAALADAGIKGSDAGTSLKTMLMRLVPQTAEAEAAMTQYGLSFTNADGSIKNLTEVAGLLQEKLGGLSEAERNTALQTIFGTDAFRAAAVMMKEGSTGLAEYETATTRVGVAQEAAEAALGPTARAMEEFKGSVETAGISIGEKLAPAVSGAAETLTGLVNKFDELSPTTQNVILGIAGAAASLGPLALAVSAAAKTIAVLRLAVLGKVASMLAWKAAWLGVRAVMGVQFLISAIGSIAASTGAWIANTAAMIGNRIAWLASQAAAGVGFIISAVGALAAATGGWIANTAAIVANRIATLAANGVMLLVRGAIVAWTAVQWALNAAMYANPIGLVVLAIVALIAIVVLAWKNSETFREIVTAAWEAVKNAIGAAVEWIKTNVSKWLSDTVAWFREKFDAAKQVAQEIWDNIKAGIAAAVDGIKSAVGGFSQMVANVKQWFSDLSAGISQRMEDAKAAVSSVVESIKGFFGNARSWLVNAGKEIIGGLIDGIQSMLGAAGSAVSGIVSAINPFGRGFAGEAIPEGAQRGATLAATAVGISRAVQAPRLRMDVTSQAARDPELGRIKRDPVTNVSVFVDGQRQQARVAVNGWAPNLAGAGA